MKKYIQLIPLAALLILTACDKDDAPEQDMEPDNLSYIIINNGTGGVNTVSDSNDSEALAIAQAVPAAFGETFSNNLPILLFFNDKILLSSLEGNIEVTVDGALKGGTVTINPGANGYAVMTFSPFNAFDIDKTIEFKLTAEVQDDGGNGLGQDFILNFKTKQGTTSDFDNNLGFENGIQGVEFIGDGAIMTGSQGCVDPVNGNNFASITTGDELISSDSAISGASSLMILGPITDSFSTMNFRYNFVSSEFQEFVNSEYDDSVIVTVVGPNGAYSEFLTSVNTVGLNDNMLCEGFPGLPDDGDTYAGATGWNSKSINVGNIGSPGYLIFTITDVADTAYSSAICIDAINF